MMLVGSSNFLDLEVSVAPIFTLLKEVERNELHHLKETSSPLYIVHHSHVAGKDNSPTEKN